METETELFERFVAFQPGGDVGELETALGELRERKIARLRARASQCEYLRHLKAVYSTKPAQRTCLRCGQSFGSSGPGNRLCASCLSALDAPRAACQFPQEPQEPPTGALTKRGRGRPRKYKRPRGD